MKKLFAIISNTIRELLFEKVFLIWALFTALCLILSLLMGRMTYTEEKKITLDFMLGLSHVAMILFSIFASFFVFQKEIAQGNIALILSKPISRAHYFFGKFIGQALFSFLLVVGFFLSTLLLTDNFNRTYLIAIATNMLFLFYETCLLTALTYFFSNFLGTFVAVGALFLVFGLGHFQGFLSKQLHPSEVSFTAFKLLQNMVPDLEIFNFKTFASYGFHPSHFELVYITGYFITLLALYLLSGWLVFEKRSLQT